MKKAPAQHGQRKATDVDREIGLAIRAVRVTSLTTMDQLANGIGVTFQQIQKYESGASRISAGRLYDIARFFDVPITEFFHEDAVTLERQIRAAEREVDKRLSVYPRLIEKGDMSECFAREELACMRAIVRTLKGLKDGRN